MAVSANQFDIMIPEVTYSEEVYDTAEAKGLSPVDALNACKHDRYRVDLGYLSAVCPGFDEKTLFLLRDRGLVFQDPEYFRENKYSPSEGWVFRENFLSGYLIGKLSAACEMNRFYRGAFTAEIAALESKVPAPVPFSDINVFLGAPWCPHEVYEKFISSLLQFVGTVSVRFSKADNKWILEPSPTAKYSLMKSIANNYTYGTKTMPGQGASPAHTVTGLEIIEDTMNARTVKVYDSVYSGASSPPKRVLNRQATVAAQDKQMLIIRKFREFVKSDEEIKKTVVKAYHSSFVGYVPGKFDGSALEFPGLNPEVKLRPAQKDGVAFICQSDTNSLIAHGNGAGKTHIIVCAAHELYRTGLSEKTLVVVPNNRLVDTAKLHGYLYPDDTVLAIRPSDFVPSKRDESLRKIREGGYTAAYIAYSSFDMIRMSKAFHAKQMEDEIFNLRRMSAAAKNPSESREYAKKADRLSEKLLDYNRKAEDTPWDTFDSLGIDTIFLDESQNYRRIPVSTNTDGITGLAAAGSKKCAEMLDKVHFCKRAVFFSGTPLSNSLADLFAIQTYLQPEVLRFHKIDSFDMWITTFAERETRVEVGLDGQLRQITRFSRFNNLPELMSMFSSVCDYYECSDLDDLPKFSGYTDVTVPLSVSQAEYKAEISDRADMIAKGAVKSDEDNYLKIITDERKCTIDPRLVGKKVFDGETAKIGKCRDNVVDVYLKYPGTCQIVFCDIGISGSGFNVYDELRDQLTAKGIPEKEIAFIHDATSEAQRTKLFDRMNSGDLRVVIGSTAKLGVGVNVQEKLKAIHHLSIPWRPCDMTQRNGRIIRSGNTCGEVLIFRYITEDSFDAFNWQIIENKQCFISSFLSGFSIERNADDISDTVLDYAEIKALAVGDPLIKKRVQRANELDRARIAFRSRQKQLLALRETVGAIPDEMREIENQRGIMALDQRFYAAKKRKMVKRYRERFGEKLLHDLSLHVLKDSDLFFAKYQGFDIFLPANMTAEHPYIRVTSKNGGCYYVKMDGDSPLGCAQRIDNLLESFGKRIKELDGKYAECEKNRSDALAEIGKGNEYEDTVIELTIGLEDIDREIENRNKEDAQ